jgi:hypothetical protein
MEMVTVGREVVVHGRLILSAYPKKVGDEKLTAKGARQADRLYLCGKKPVRKRKKLKQRRQEAQEH